MFTSEHVPKVPITRSTGNFCSHAICVHSALHCTWNFLIKAWPAAAGVKFGIRSVQWRIAPSTHVGSLEKKIIILPCAGRFRTFMDDYIFFRRGKFV